MRFLGAVLLASGLNAALFLVNPYLFAASITVAPVAAAAWTLLSSAAAPLLARPGRTYFVEPGSGGAPGARGMLRYSLMPALFSFSAATVAADIVGFETASEEAFAYMAAYTLILLPLFFVGALKYTIDVLEIRCLEGGGGRLDVPGWMEDFIGGGALISFLLYLRGLSPVLSPAGAAAYGVVYMLVTVTPSLTAMLAYAALGSPRVARKILGRTRPVLARLEERLVCPSCGASVDPALDRCGACGAALRIP